MPLAYSMQMGGRRSRAGKVHSLSSSRTSEGFDFVLLVTKVDSADISLFSIGCTHCMLCHCSLREEKLVKVIQLTSVGLVDGRVVLPIQARRAPVSVAACHMRGRSNKTW